MAKTSKIVKNEKRKVIVERYAEKRAQLKKTLVDPKASDEDREAARVGLQKLPRDASPIRVRNRDAIDGRPAVLSRSSEFPVSGSAIWLTVVSFQVSRRAPGNQHTLNSRICGAFLRKGPAFSYADRRNSWEHAVKLPFHAQFRACAW